MVSADNLNLDVIELIFSYISERDLVAVTLVSRSFFAGVIPRLYSTIAFRMSHVRKYKTGLSPFAVINKHPDLAIHVRYVDITNAPKINLKTDPRFLLECINALELCRNLMSFNYTVDMFPPSLLRCLQGKSRLQDLRIVAKLSTEQAARLSDTSGLQSVTLEWPSWTILDILPTWTASLQRTLTSLTLFMATSLNYNVLQKVLTQLPRLTGLHVVGCQGVDHVAIYELVDQYTSFLEDLSCTVWSPCPMASYFSLIHLRNLSIDMCYSLAGEEDTTLLSAIFSSFRIASPPLSSFALRISGKRYSIPKEFIQELTGAYGSSLKAMSFGNCDLDLEIVKILCTKCTALEALEFPLPVKDHIKLTHSLSPSSSLHTLIDFSSAHDTHGIRPSLTSENVRNMMFKVKKLRKIVTGGRVWTGLDCKTHATTHVNLEKSRTRHSTHWFTPGNSLG